MLFFFKLFTYNFRKQITTATFAGGGDSFVWLFIKADKARARGEDAKRCRCGESEWEGWVCVREAVGAFKFPADQLSMVG